MTTAVLGVAVAMTTAACSVGGLPTPGPSADASAPTPASAAPDATPIPSPRPTEVPGPPSASLAGGLEGPVAGDLGTFYWGGLGSDSPWIVPSSALHTRAGTPLLVALDPALVPERWTVSWTPIRDGTAGRIADRMERARNPITFMAPVQAGAWGAQVELHFPSGERTAFYWRVDVVP
ncbi:MAG: hypothetical protein MUQ32_14815 [Chloroflexi bacterium]|nr:hypothetical protein [Chloroflexota bacterium]